MYVQTTFHQCRMLVIRTSTCIITETLISDYLDYVIRKLLLIAKPLLYSFMCISCDNSLKTCTPRDC